MPHLAAVVPAPKAPLVVREVDTPPPGPNELLIKNEIIALQPIDAKLARLALLPMEYPAVLGFSFAGTVQKVGANVSNFAVGDKVVAAKTAGAIENKYSAQQTHVISNAVTTTKIPDGVTLQTAVCLVGNLPTLIALFNATLQLARPEPSHVTKRGSQGRRILVYGGSSSVGSMSVQYLTQAGYDVVTTTSPRNEAFVSKLGGSRVIKHTQPFETTLEELVAAGPYDVVVDTISTTETVKLVAEVLVAQGGGDVYALQPPFAPETLPAGVSRKFEGWSLLFAKEENAELLKWTFDTYFPHALANNSLVPVEAKKITGGLSGLYHALDILHKGVSSEKLIVDPWE